MYVHVDYFQHTSKFLNIVIYDTYSDAGVDEEGQNSPTANAASSSSSSSSSSNATSPTSPKGGGGARGELPASRGAEPTTSHLSSEHGTHKKKTRDRIHTSPNLIRKKKEVSKKKDFSLCEECFSKD